METSTTYEQIRNAIFDFVYHEALNDATLQKAYEEDKNDVEKISEVKDAVRKYIDDILSGDKKTTFDDTVNSVRKELDKKGIRNDKFTFGNIQKLINMTVKYFYILCYNKEELRKNFRCCHCPMDSKMIKKVTPRGHKNEVLRSTTSWSKIDDNGKQAYNEFQSAISKKINDKYEGENISPIEFDYLEWQESNNKKKTND